MSWIPSHQEALDLMHKYNTQEALVKHAFADEAVMRHFAGFFRDQTRMNGGWLVSCMTSIMRNIPRNTVK